MSNTQGNNQPQSQQTPSESAPKHVEPHKQRKYMEPYAGWPENNPHPLEGDDAKAFNEERKKNERKKVPSSERSHSPTEQPGDAKHTPTPWIPWETPMVHQGKYFQCPVESAHPDGIINVAMAFGVTREECKANADLIARAPALLSEVATLRSKQAELVAEIKELERHKKELALCLEQANQLIRRYEGIEREQSAELEQLRSELDKMMEALKISKSWVSQITNVYLEEGRDKIVSIIESALSGDSK